MSRLSVVEAEDVDADGCGGSSETRVGREKRFVSALSQDRVERVRRAAAITKQPRGLEQRGGRGSLDGQSAQLNECVCPSRGRELAS